MPPIPRPRCGLCEHYRSNRGDGTPKIKGYGWCSKKEQEVSPNQLVRTDSCFELRKPHGWETPQVNTVDVNSWSKVVDCGGCPCLDRSGEHCDGWCRLADRGWPMVGSYTDPIPYWCPLRVGPAVIMLKEVDGA